MSKEDKERKQKAKEDDDNRKRVRSDACAGNLSCSNLRKPCLDKIDTPFSNERLEGTNFATICHHLCTFGHPKYSDRISPSSLNPRSTKAGINDSRAITQAGLQTGLQVNLSEACATTFTAATTSTSPAPCPSPRICHQKYHEA